MSPQEANCMGIICEARAQAEQLRAAGSPSEDQAAQRAPYRLVGIRWVDGVLYYEAEFEEKEIPSTEYSSLMARRSKPKLLVRSNSSSGAEGHSTSLGSTVRIKWITASFEIHEIDPEKALRLLENQRLVQHLSACPPPKNLLYCVLGRDWDTVKVDEEGCEVHHD